MNFYNNFLQSDTIFIIKQLIDWFKTDRDAMLSSKSDGFDGLIRYIPETAFEDVYKHYSWNYNESEIKLFNNTFVELIDICEDLGIDNLITAKFIPNKETYEKWSIIKPRTETTPLGDYKEDYKKYLKKNYRNIYDGVINKKLVELSQSALKDFLNHNMRSCELTNKHIISSVLYYYFHLDDDTIHKLHTFLNNYLSLFIRDELSFTDYNLFSFDFHWKKYLPKLQQYNKLYGKSFLILFEDFKRDEDEMGRSKSLILEFILALEYMGLIDVNDISIDNDYEEDDVKQIGRFYITVKRPIDKQLIDNGHDCLNCETNSINFDTKTCHLTLGKAIIAIKSVSDQYYLLDVIFRNKDETFKEWQFSEIAELIDPRIETITDKGKREKIRKQYYNAIDQIKKKVAIETGIKDLFITSRQTVKINPKYKVA